MTAQAMLSVTSLEGAMGRSITLDEDGPFHSITHHLRARPGAISAEEVDDGRPVHPESRKLFRKCGGRLNCVRYIPIYGQAIECYSLRFLFGLCCTSGLSKGIAYVLVMFALNPMFMRRFNCNSDEYQRYYTVARMGWSIKPFTALCTDSVAFFGYKKRWFMSISAAFAFACSIVMGLLPPHHSSAVVGAVMAFLIGYGQANLDILSEGIYSRKIRAHPSGGPSLISSLWIVQMIAGIVAALVQGPLSDAGLEQVGLFICSGCMFFCIPIYLLNWMAEGRNKDERRHDAIIHKKMERKEREEAAENNKEEETLNLSSAVAASKYSHASLSQAAGTGAEADREQQNNDAGAPNKATHMEVDEDDEDLLDDKDVYIPTFCGGAIEFNKEVVMRSWRITLFCVLMTVVVVFTAVVTLLWGMYTILATIIAGTLVLTAALFWSLPLVVAKAGLFGFINQALYVNITGALDSYYLGGPICNPGGPNFSYFFYNTTTGVIGYVAGALGVAGFNYIFSKRSYRVTFIITICAEIVGSVFDLILVKRWNLPAIPDHYMYVFGDAVVYQAAYMLAWMPMVILMAQLCPRGSEAMVYALLAALSNYGQTVSGEIGVLLMAWVWPVPADLKTQVCDFHHLWKLVIVSHMALPCFIMVFVFILIPGARICDELDANGHAKPKLAPVTDRAAENNTQLEEREGGARPAGMQSSPLNDPLDENPWFEPVPVQGSDDDVPVEH